MAALSAAAVVLLPGAPASAAPPPPGVCDTPAAPGSVITDLPWPQRLFDAPRIWPVTTGAGITVAVLDSGVDGTHPQLAAQVWPGFDFVRNVAGADFDCTSHGTATASLIAAKHADGVPFEGLAPGAKILPLRVNDSPDVLAQAIRYAADQNAKIINVSIAIDKDTPALAQAVDYAITTKGCLVVATVGTRHTTADASLPPIGSNRNPVPNDPPSYPASYDNVLGVAAVDEHQDRLPESPVGNYVDLSAPGDRLVTATRASGHQYAKDPTLAPAYVSATAALLWSSQPYLKNSDVSWRLRITSDRIAGGSRSNEFGYGMVDPYRAVTEAPPRDDPGSGQPIPPAAAPAAAPHRSATARTAAWIGLAVLLATGLLFAARAAYRLGRARGWRPAEPSPPPSPAERPF
ncbi:S8 family serine peptidase [Dactylosporangium sp. CA-139066]|uniref:S8 family serine peptidase n=1 Tax=Dactylosporangium sp. CA-139066 TaxID=3239930 RepID=UPI003D91FE5A